MIEYCMVMEQQKPTEIDYEAQEQILMKSLELLLDAFKTAPDYSQKLAILDNNSQIKSFLKSSPILGPLVDELDIPGQFAVKALLAIGQGDVVFQDLKSVENPKECLRILVQQLLEIEKFYDKNGGIVGYHLSILKLLNVHKHGTTQGAQDGQILYEMPTGLDISANTPALNEVVRSGVDSMRFVGEMYPVGGAGDRLNLKDEETGELLPAAQLQFCGRSLLELLVRDLLGREFLHYKLFEEQLVTPLAIMTSHEKNNHQRILEICEVNGWFGRPEESYRFFIQPLVPMVTVEGNWAISSPMRLILKPGGHGVIWKAAMDEGIFDWFAKHQRKKILVRQINNPMAGIDAGLLALSGIGCQKNKDFGFASCPRLVASSEGMDVLREVKQKDGYEYTITNIEYTEFQYRGIQDVAEHSESPYSRFPANTNVLFGDLSAIKKAVDVCSIPGMLINLKSRVKCYSPNGFVEINAGRLESTMQNIADYMVDKSSDKLSQEQKSDLRTFLTYNERRKTISVTKQSYVSGKSLTDTPEGCFYDLLKNYRDLLINYCHMQMPLEQDEGDYLTSGPDCVVLFHPALGTLYPVIGQKIRGGKLASGAEWILEIAEAEVENMDLDGSLIIEAESVMGKKDAYGVLTFDSNQCGKCTLLNVKVKNQGRVRSSGVNAWRCQFQRKEALRITLHGNAEFFAENVELHGDVHFDVPEGHRLVVYQQGKEIAWHFEKITQASWKWDYFFDEDGRIVLEKVKVSR